VQPEPMGLRELMARAPFRTLVWPRRCGVTLAACPPILAASFLPYAGRPTREDMRCLLDSAAYAYADGGAFLLLATHAYTRDKAKAELLRVHRGAVAAPLLPEALH
jgi:hypothetical protein